MSQFCTSDRAEHPLVAEDLAQLLVADLRQRREHHDDEPDGNGDVGRSALKAVYKASRGRHEVTYGYADCHGQEDPERQEAIQKGQLLARGRGADLAVSDGGGRH